MTDHKQMLLEVLDEMIRLKKASSRKADLSDLMPQFGERLRNYRDCVRDITRPQLGALLGVSAQTIYRWEIVQGAPPPKIDSLFRLRDEVQNPSALLMRDKGKNDLAQPLEEHLERQLAFLDQECGRRGLEKTWPYEVWLFNPQALALDDIKQLKVILETGLNLHTVLVLDIVNIARESFGSEWSGWEFLDECTRLGADLSESGGTIYHHFTNVWPGKEYDRRFANKTDLLEYNLKLLASTYFKYPVEHLPNTVCLPYQAIQTNRVAQDLIVTDNVILATLVWHYPGNPVYPMVVSHVLQAATKNGETVTVGWNCPKAEKRSYNQLVHGLIAEFKEVVPNAAPKGGDPKHD